MSQSDFSATDFPNHEEGTIGVGDGHTLYWRSHGNPRAPAVVILHGGPGGAHNPRLSFFFDPAFWRVVLFDQRGCGQSTPHASTEHNTVDKLVADMELLREALAIERWALFGGSWGTRLALAYGVAHPLRCTGFMMRGVFLGRPEDIQWFLWDAKLLFPDAHADFLSAIEAACSRRPQSLEELLRFAAPVLTAGHPQRQALASAWDLYEWRMATVQPMPAIETEGDAGVKAQGKALSLATLEHHYMANVLPGEPSMLDLVKQIAHIPCEIVHGRYDIVCPVSQAWQLAKAWPAASLSIAPTSGHWALATEMAALLQAASAKLAMRIRRQSLHEAI